MLDYSAANCGIEPELPSHAARPLAPCADFRNGSDPLGAGRPGDTEGVLALVCGAVGGLLVPRFSDLLVIGVSAVSGAAMVMTGANHIFPKRRIFRPCRRRRVTVTGHNNSSRCLCELATQQNCKVDSNVVC
jgi:hypothetical protein